SILIAAATACAVMSAGCGSTAHMDIKADQGAHPVLPPPHKSLLPTIHIAPAEGWQGAEKPSAPSALVVNAFATGLSHPRWLYVLPNGDVLVAETDAPPKPDDAKGIRGKIYKAVQKEAGSGKRPSANRITLLRDTNGDGVADLHSVFLSGLSSPVGMALVGNSLYVANTDAVLRFPYTPGATQIEAHGTKLVDLPGGPLNHHWTKTLIASP